MRAKLKSLLTITSAAILALVQNVLASDILLRCSTMPDGLPKIKYCLAHLKGLSAGELLAVYDNVSRSYYVALKDIDKAIEFETKAAEEGDLEQSPTHSSDPVFSGLSQKLRLIAYIRSRSRAYEILSEMEELKSMTLDVKGNDLHISAKYATAALLHASKAIVIYSGNYEAYAVRARIEGRYCKEEDAESDKNTAIDLARQGHNDDSASDYEAIQTDNCSEDHRGLID